MAAALILLGLGWWLVVLSGVGGERRPFLSVHPSQEVAMGDIVTLQCHVPRPAPRVLVYKEGDGSYLWYQSKVTDMAEFSVEVLTRDIGGRYRCRYEILNLSKSLKTSNAVELVVLDTQFPPPTVSLSPGGCVGTGTNVTIQCESMYGATFILHKAGRSGHIQRKDPDVRGTATFVLPEVTPSDSGTYGCSYRPRGHPFISSHPSAEVTLQVGPGGPSTTSTPPLPPDFSLINTVRLVLGAGVLVVLLLLRFCWPCVVGGPTLMAVSLILLGLGWWLVVLSGVGGEPRPSLSVHPSEELVVGDIVTLRCCVPRPAPRVLVYKEGDWRYRQYRDGVKDVAEFSLEVSTKDIGGRYRCRYEIPELSWALKTSDPLELVLLNFPPPATVSLKPKGRVGMGTNVSIQCQSTYGATFILHKAGRSGPIQRKDPDVRGTATFVLPDVIPSDSGTYGCSYRPRGHPFISSHPSAEVTLQVGPGGPSTASVPPLPPDFSLGNTIRLVLGAGVLVVLVALVGAEILPALCRGGP
ncbi:leukocyte immunoglobulin-like receptor subfamily B member 2 [Rhea pennata]|uniref:leukocyte immunoglobulin-like receptor subfamily B member 2 n=1 Tax=Rhea pennata TaxID=8795 RepID=UPI002E2596A4